MRIGELMEPTIQRADRQRTIMRIVRATTGAILMAVRLLRRRRLLAITRSPPRGTFKRSAERHAQRDPEADVPQGSSHGNANRHADRDARTRC